MNVWIILSFSALWSACAGLDLKFPPGFKFGAATSAYQVEGAWNVSDKGWSVWDRVLHEDPSVVVDGSTGQTACNSYHLWREDVHIAHDLGLHFYRFSVSWTRLLPNGFPSKISQDGVNYYNKLIDGLLEKGIEPIITLYHFDLPDNIQNLGGWTNPMIADWFADYASVAFAMFADRVKTWITINEPLMMCDFTYNVGRMAPFVTESWLGPFLCNKNVLLAHAKSWRIYDEKYKGIYGGKVSIANNPLWLYPKSKDEEELTELAREFATGRYSDPIYSKEGGWPPSVEKMMAEYSKKQGFPYSRLPSFTEEEKKLIQGTHDFYALNFYSSRVVRRARENEVPGHWFTDGSKELNIVLETDPEWPVSDFPYVVVTPEGIRHQISWISKRYNNVSILITENGIGTKSSDLHDTARIHYIRDHLEQILLAIQKDGSDVFGYTVWSLMDNYEWTFGYTLKFGVYHVDFSDPLLKRTPRASAHFYKSVIKHHSLDVPHPSHNWKAEAYNSGRMITSSIVLISLISLGILVYR